MIPRGIQSDLKSIPQSKSIKTLLTLTDHGTAGAVTNQGAAQFRIVDDNTIEYHEGLLAIHVKTTGGKGGTPTAVGANITFTLKYAFSDYDLDTAEITTVLASSAKSFIMTLPNAISARATGTLTLSGVPAVGDNVIIGAPAQGAITPQRVYPYTWDTLAGLTSRAWGVNQNASAANAATALINAINGTGTPGTDYTLGMPTNTLVTAVTGGAGIVTLRSVEYSTRGNNITTVENGANSAFGGATLTGGSSAGTAIFQTDPFVHGGKFLYIWYDRLAFAANALIDVEAKLIRL
jgi:hypothetical protein